MIENEHKPSDLKPDKINNDLSSLSLKLLAKLGALSRNRDPPIVQQPKQVELLPLSLRFTSEIELGIGDCLDYAV